jgi:hypothetical protein
LYISGSGGRQHLGRGKGPGKAWKRKARIGRTAGPRTRATTTSSPSRAIGSGPEMSSFPSASLRSKPDNQAPPTLTPAQAAGRGAVADLDAVPSSVRSSRVGAVPRPPQGPLDQLPHSRPKEPPSGGRSRRLCRTRCKAPCSLTVVPAAPIDSRLPTPGRAQASGPDFRSPASNPRTWPRCFWSSWAPPWVSSPSITD